MEQLLSNIKIKYPSLLERIKAFVIQYKYYCIGISVVAVYIVSGILFVAVPKKHISLPVSTSEQNTSSAKNENQNPQSAKKSTNSFFGLFSFGNPDKSTSNTDKISPTQSQDSKTKDYGNSINTLRNSSLNVASKSNGSPQNSSNSLVSSTHISGENGTGTTPNAPVDIQFQDANGKTITYTSSAAPAFAVIWFRYTNFQDHYAIDYPSNWIIIKTLFKGHEGLNLFPPDTDTNQNNPPKIGVGWTNKYYLPNASGPNGALIQSITLGEIGRAHV